MPREIPHVEILTHKWDIWEFGEKPSFQEYANMHQHNLVFNPGNNKRILTVTITLKGTKGDFLGKVKNCLIVEIVNIQQN